MAKIISGIGSALRPAAKQLIKGGLAATNAISRLASDTGGEFKALVVEARSELTASHETPTKVAAAEHKGIRDRVVSAGHAVTGAAAGAATGIMSTTNDAIVMLFAWFKGESKAKAEQQVEELEEHIKKDERAVVHFVRDVSKDLASEECAYVIETMMLMAA